jgi:hypothetical protein
MVELHGEISDVIVRSLQILKSLGNLLLIVNSSTVHLFRFDYAIFDCLLLQL